MVVQSRRERMRQTTIEEIKAIARSQMDLEGVGTLSLGKIAREMGVTTPALYRYFENRDALVTELIIDAYESLANWMESAVADMAADAFALRFRTQLLAYRGWAVAHPAEYGLCFGAPLAGYDAPVDRVMPGAVRSLKQMAGLLASAEASSILRIPNAYFHPPATLDAPLRMLQQALEGTVIAAPIITVALMTWLHVHALVWQELHGHLPKPLLGQGALYEMEVDVMAERLGLTNA